MRQLVVCMVGGMMDGSHGSCDDDFSSVERCVRKLVVCMVGGMPDGSHGSVMMVFSSVVRGCETVGCLYVWWYDGWFSWFL